MMEFGGALHAIRLTIYTDAFVIVGTVNTTQRRISDILNYAEEPFLVIEDVTFDSFGTTGQTQKAAYAQINLASVLFAVAQDVVEPAPELRTTKQIEPAIISVPPFNVTGQIHLLPERSLRHALQELTATFIPVTDAAYWSDHVNEARATAPLIAVNRQRAQIMAPHEVVDPWAGLSTPTGSAESGEPGETTTPPDSSPSGW